MLIEAVLSSVFLPRQLTITLGTGLIKCRGVRVCIPVVTVSFEAPEPPPHAQCCMAFGGEGALDFSAFGQNQRKSTSFFTLALSHIHTLFPLIELYSVFSLSE